MKGRKGFYPGSLALGFALLWIPPLAASGQSDALWIEADRVVATLDGEPILLSDILLEEELGLLESDGGAGQDRVRDAFLNRLLILREVEEVGGFRLAGGLEESAYEGYLGRFETPQEYRDLLARWGLDDGEVRRRLNRALLASLYTENRIRFFVRVLPADVERAYNEDPQHWGDKGLPEVWDQIRASLEEEAFDHEKGRWLGSLAARFRLHRFDAEGGEEP